MFVPKTPLPRSVCIRIVCVAALCAMLFVLIGLTVFLTDGRDIGEFTRTDWQIFGAFVFVSIIDLIAAFFIASRAGQGLAARRHQAFLAHLHEGIDPADYACVIADDLSDRRVLVRQDADGCVFSVEIYHLGAWQPDGPPQYAATFNDLLQMLEEEYCFLVGPEDLPPSAGG